MDKVKLGTGKLPSSLVFPNENETAKSKVFLFLSAHPEHLFDNINQVFFISTSGDPPVNKIDLQSLTLAGPTRNQPVQSPLAVQPTICVTSFSRISYFSNSKINLKSKSFNTCLKHLLGLVHNW